jgi:hypothetical protein
MEAELLEFRTRLSYPSERELIEPHKGDKRYVSRDEQGRFTNSQDNVSRSPSAARKDRIPLRYVGEVASADPEEDEERAVQTLSRGWDFSWFR